MTSAVLGKLRAFVTGSLIEECELCAQSIAVEHAHLLEPGARRVFCACQACAELFAREPELRGARYLKLERRAQRLRDLELEGADWADLGVPVGIAFFTLRGQTGEVVATFPGRAGLIESFVPLKAWSELERRFPSLKAILPDVEALLVRSSLRHRDYFRVSIDHCYELSNLLRSVDVSPLSPEFPAVHAFFTRLDERAGERGHSRRPRA